MKKTRGQKSRATVPLRRNKMQYKMKKEKNDQKSVIFISVSLLHTYKHWCHQDDGGTSS
jgi:hypothetical protein